MKRNEPGQNPLARHARKIGARLFSRENWMALALCVIIILLIIFTSGTSPRWIYQGF